MSLGSIANILSALNTFDWFLLVFIQWPLIPLLYIFVRDSPEISPWQWIWRITALVCVAACAVRVLWPYRSAADPTQAGLPAVGLFVLYGIATAYLFNPVCSATRSDTHT